MTQEELIEMAREAGFKMENSAAMQAAKAFYKLATAQEREACANVCDEYDIKYDVNTCDTAEGIALEIRARGEA